MPLYSLSYISRAPELRGELRKEYLKNIEASSRSHNCETGVCGVLVHVDDYFIQVMEGSRGPLNETYHRIINDERHHDIHLLRVYPIVSRQFTTKDVTTYQVYSKDHPLFLPYKVRQCFDPYHLPPDGTLDLLDKLSKVFKTLGERDRKKRAA
ncbi:MAG: BLUF domain-containing protein [Pseudomonadota bacterium]